MSFNIFNIFSVIWRSIFFAIIVSSETPRLTPPVWTAGFSRFSSVFRPSFRDSVRSRWKGTFQRRKWVLMTKWRKGPEPRTGMKIYFPPVSGELITLVFPTNTVGFLLCFFHVFVRLDKTVFIDVSWQYVCFVYKYMENITCNNICIKNMYKPTKIWSNITFVFNLIRWFQLIFWILYYIKKDYEYKI